MMQSECPVAIGENRFQCPQTGLIFTVLPQNLPLTCSCPRRIAVKGPGDYLHDAILKWVGEGPTRECSCRDRINKMNAWGPTGCREHLDEIVGWLVEQAKGHKWVAVDVDADGNETVSDASPPIIAKLARWMTKRHGGAVLIGVFVRQIVLAAIRKAKKPTP